MAARAPWVVAAVAQAIAIAGLAVLLATRESAARVDGDTSQRVVARAEALHGGTAPSAAAPGAGGGAPRVDEATGPRAAEDAATATTDLGTLVHGDVRARGAAALPWAIVEIFAGDAAKATALDRVSGSDTQYAIAGLADGDYRLVAKAEGFRDLEHRFTVPPGLASLRLDVELQPSWIVKVLLLAPDRRPLHEVLAEQQDLPRVPLGEPVAVIASWRPLPAQLPASDQHVSPFTVGTWTSGRRRSFGREAELPARYAGQLEMREHRDAIVAAVFRDVVLAQQPVAAGQDEVTLTVDPQQLHANVAAVRLQVVDGATGAPATDAKVLFNDPQTYRGPFPVDEQGRFEASHLAPGRYRLGVSAGVRTAPTFHVDLPPGRTTDLGTIAVVDAVTLRIRVPELASDPEPIAFALQPLDVATAGALTPAPRPTAMAKGSVDSRIPPGRYVLRVTHKGTGKGVLREIDTRHLGSEPLVLTLAEEAALRIDPSHVDEPVRLELRTAAGHPVYGRWITWTRPFEVPLPAGDYRVRTAHFGGAVRDEAISLPAAGAKFVLR